MQTFSPFRSMLYIPGSKARALEKAKSLATDAIIFDLEDAVAIDEKAKARNMLAAALRTGGYGSRVKIVRVNALDSAWGKADVDALKEAGADAFLLPKVESSDHIQALADLLGDALAAVPIWAMMETPMGILKAAEIAAHPRLQGMVMGTNDLAKELRCRAHPDRAPLLSSLQLCLLAARAHGVVAVDGVYNAFKDVEGLARECEQGRDMGFDGKTLIHPAQLATANAAFAPSEAEITLARRQIEAFEAAEAAGQGVAVVDGSIVENLHIVTARQTLAKANIIAALEGDA